MKKCLGEGCTRICDEGSTQNRLSDPGVDSPSNLSWLPVVDFQGNSRDQDSVAALPGEYMLVASVSYS